MGHALGSIKGQMLKVFRIPECMNSVHLSWNLIWTILWKERKTQAFVFAKYVILFV